MGAFPKTANSLENGRALFGRGEYAKAIPMLLSAASYDASNFQTQFLLGICYLRTNAIAAAEQSFRRAVALNNGAHEAHYYLGLTLERQGRNEDARLEYRFALAIKPDFAEAQKRLGVADGPSRWTAGSGEVSSVPQPQNAQTAGPADAEKRHLAPGELYMNVRRRMRSYSFLYVFSLVSLIAFGVGLIFLIALYICSRCTRYLVYQNLIEIRTGVFSKQRISVWMYEIQDVAVTRSFFNLITGDSTIVLRTSEGPLNLTGLGNSKFMNKLFEQFREVAFAERREIKKWWV